MDLRLSDGRSSQLGAAHGHRMGLGLAEAARQLIESAEEAGETVRARSRHVELPERQVRPDQAELSRRYLDSGLSMTESAGFTKILTGHAYTFHGNAPATEEAFARGVVDLWKEQHPRSDNVPLQIEVQVLRIGELAVVGYPGEIFAELGRATRLASPFPTTMVVGLANGLHGYIPTEEAFGRGGYETRLTACEIEAGAGEELVAAASGLLQEMADDFSASLVSGEESNGTIRL
ncbi:MAG: hypothetical protein ACYDGR_04505 [Candidatus Dormibacteria bacterium]